MSEKQNIKKEKQYKRLANDYERLRETFDYSDEEVNLDKDLIKDSSSKSK